MLFIFYPATKVFWACGMRSHQLLPLSVRLAFPCFQPPLVMNGNPVGGGGGRERGVREGARTDVSLCQRISSLRNGAGDWQLTEQGQVAGVLGVEGAAQGTAWI